MTPAAPSPEPVDIHILRTVAAGAYYDPHAVLGPHIGEDGVTVRALRPLADRVAVMEGGRLHHALPVDLPRPRGRDVRYSPRFNALCRELRQAMDHQDAGRQAMAGAA